MIMTFNKKDEYIIQNSRAMLKYRWLFLLLVLATPLRLPAQDDMASLKLLLANESNDEAIALFYRLVKNDKDNSELLFLGAMTHRRLMRQDSSLLYLQKAATLNPEDEKILTALAGAYTDMNRYTNAKEILEDLIKKDSTKLAPHIQLAALYLRDNQPRVALDIYYYLHGREPSNYNYLKSIAMCYRRSGNDMKAVNYYKKAHELAPSDLSINIALAGLYLKMKNYEEGLVISERGLKVDNKNNEMLFWNGFFNYATGNYKEALSKLLRSEQLGNESANIIQYIGICYYLLGNHAMARDYLEKTVSLNVNSFRIYNYLGIIYREMKDFQISERYFNNSLAVLSPPVRELTETYQHLVETHKQAGEMEKAADAYRAALVYDSDNPYLYYGLAYTLDNHLSDKASALEAYLRFSEIASGIKVDDKDLSTFLDHSNTRIRRIREEKFFEGH